MVSPQPAGTSVPLPQRLRDDLVKAMKARDRPAVSVLRSTLAAIENAEAPAVGNSPSWPPNDGLVEHARHELSEADVERIVHRELAERVAAADQYERLGRDAEADDLRAEIATLTVYVA
jgi:uncharacterized protein YqeY